MTDTTPTPETARALLYRHGLPEDVIDGVLCLHAQELAAVQRREADDLHQTEPGVVKGLRIGADLIDPAKTDGQPTPAALSGRALRDRVTEALLTTPQAGWNYTIGDPKWDHHQHGDRPGHRYSIACALCIGDVEALAAAVVGMLAADNRAGVRARAFRDAEEICDEAGAVYTSKALNEQADGAYALMERFRRKAEEAEQTAAVVPPPTGQAAVLLWAADRIDEGWFTTAASATAELRRLAAEPQQTQTETHSCGNCEGIDPDSCLMNPDRAAAPVPVEAAADDEEAPVATHSCGQIPHTWGCVTNYEPRTEEPQP